jgi:ribosome-associated protein
VLDVEGSPTLARLPAAQRERLLRRLGPRLVDGTLTVIAAEYRSQLRNRDAATARLVQLLRGALAPAPPTRRPTRPTAGSQRRRLTGKAQRSQTKRLRRPPQD